MKALIAVLAIIVLLMTSLFGVLPSLHQHSHGCPFMPTEHSQCLMDTIDHLATWESYILFVLPVLFITLLSLFTACELWFAGSDRIPISPTKKNEPPPPLIELFSSGVLHPKIPHHG